MHLGGHCYNKVELLTSKGAEKSTVASAADCEVEADSLTAGHERKHNACRAESEVVLVVIPQAQTGLRLWISIAFLTTPTSVSTVRRNSAILICKPMHIAAVLTG